MLVLVTARNACLTQSLASVSFLMLLIVGTPTSALAQFGEGSSTSTSVSVLASSDSNENIVSEANRAATIANSSKLSVRPFDSPPAFPQRPKPPHKMLVPQSPDLDSFTRPQVSSEEFANELRGGEESNNVVTASFSSPAQDRSNAVGTLATTNQGRQNPSSFPNNRPSVTPGQSRQFSRPNPGLTSPNNARSTFTPPAVSSFGDSSGASNRSSASSRAPSVPSEAFSSSVTTSSASASGSTASANPAVPGASAWRRPDPSEANQSSANRSQGYQPGRVAANSQATSRVGQPAGTRFNPSANSTYNQGVNPNIASGAPRVSYPQNRQANRNFNNQSIRQPQQSFNRDSSVQPTGFAQPAAPRKIKTDVAKQLIARYSTDGINPQQLSGQPVKLFEMLNQPISTEQRRPMIHQFWDTYFDWASLVNSQQYLRLLDDIPGSSGAADQALLEMAKMDAKNEVLASEIELVKSQSKLAQFMPNRPSTLPPPIPNDLPLIQKYNTQYERYKQFQLMPANLLGIDKMLPKTLELIANRADTVQMAQSTNQKVVAGVRSRQSSVADALSAAKSWRSAEQNLLVAVMDYNHAICDYSLTVSRGYQTPQQVVGMLIAKPKTNSTNNPAASVAERFRNARNSQGNTQPADNSARSQRLNGLQNLQSTRTPPKIGNTSFGSNNNSNRSNQIGNSGQGAIRPVVQEQPVSQTVEAGATSAFRSTSGGFGNPTSGSGNAASNSNAAAAKKPQGFNLGSNNGFQPPTQGPGQRQRSGQRQRPAQRKAQNNFGGQSQLQPPNTSAQRTQPPQGPQNDPFGRTDAGSSSQFKRPFGP